MLFFSFVSGDKHFLTVNVCCRFVMLKYFTRASQMPASIVAGFFMPATFPIYGSVPPCKVVMALQISPGIFKQRERQNRILISAFI